MDNNLSDNNYRKYYGDFYKINFDTSFDVHHIDGNRNNNDISNLILLPKVCHTVLHKFEKYFNGNITCIYDIINTAYLSAFSEEDFFNLFRTAKWVDIRWQYEMELRDAKREVREPYNFYQKLINDCLKKNK